MKMRTLLWILCLVIGLGALGVQLIGQSSSTGEIPGPNNPGIFQKYKAPISSMLWFLASDQGKQVLLHSPNPKAQELLRRFHPDAVGQHPAPPLLQPPPRGPGSGAASVTVTGCGTASGTRFNLESATNAVPQNEPPLDFLLNFLSGSGNTDLVVQSGNDFRGLVGGLGGSMTGVYVHRDATQACYGGTDFELGSPGITNPFDSADMPLGLGDARVAADTVNSQFILTDLRIDLEVAGAGLRRVPAANLTSTSTCPTGTETASQAATCVGPNAVLVSASESALVDFPNLAQDPRSSGTGAGDIYITNTVFEFSGSDVALTACKAKFTSLADCSVPKDINGLDTDPQFSSVSVVPGGSNVGMITITYVNFATDDIRFVSCTPKGAPLAPTCSSPTTVTTEANPIAPLTDNTFRILFIPVIANRSDGTTFVAWHHCKVSTFLPLAFACPDSDVVMKTSTNLGASWSAVTNVDASTGTHEFMPAISVDNARNIVNIAYYHNTDSLMYKNRTQVLLKQIPSGSTTPGSAIIISTVADSPAGDPNLSSVVPQYGDYIGVAAHGGHAYVGHTNDSRLGSYNGAMNTESNNHVSKLTY